MGPDIQVAVVEASFRFQQPLLLGLFCLRLSFEFSNMAPTPINLEAIRDEITEKYKRSSVYGVLAMLELVYGMKVSRPTLFRRFKEWGINKNERTEDTDLLRARICVLYYDGLLTDGEMVRRLRMEGFGIKQWKIQELRHDMGIRRRRTLMQREEAEAEIMRVMREHLDMGKIDGYGIKHVWTYFRRHNYDFTMGSVGRTMAELAPEQVEVRKRKGRNARKTYTTLGPNDLWCLDAHCKLEDFGIQIYAAIDAFSRYILWIYVGISSRTQISVVRQYLDHVAQSGILPNRCRSDRGTETIIVAHAQRSLRKRCEGGQDEPFYKHWVFGKSTKNQRIESWWQQIQGSRLYRWVEYFKELRENGLFDSSHAADRIAILAIYMRFVREEAQEFRENWNAHHIRLQKNRPGTVKGRPWFLYTTPEEPYQESGWIPNAEMLDEFREHVAGWDPDEYLPEETLQWCYEKCLSWGYDLNNLSLADAFADQQLEHPQLYKQLRTALREHMGTMEEPLLQESVKPSGGVVWQPIVDGETSGEATGALRETVRGLDTEELQDRGIDPHDPAFGGYEEDREVLVDEEEVDPDELYEGSLQGTDCGTSS